MKSADDSNIIRPRNQLHRSRDPLWKHFPTVDDMGHTLVDFMILFPGFKKLPDEEVKIKATMTLNILNRYRHVIHYASMNLRTNVLLVSVKPLDGIHLEITRHIQAVVPEAKLVQHI